MDNEYIVFVPPTSKNIPFRITLAGITYENPTYSITRNNMDIFTAEYVISGKGYIETDGKKYIANAGDTYILSHKTHLHYYADKANPWRKIWFNASGTFPSEAARNYLPDKEVVFKNINTLDYFERILKICENKTLCGDEISKFCSAVYIEMLGQIAIELNPNDNINEEALTLKNYIDMHIEEKISIKTLSELIFRSESQTIRIFKQNYKKTPYEYILNGKINRAKILLSNTNISVKETAYRLSFTDEHYFSGIFKEKTGLSPTHFRKNPI